MVAIAHVRFVKLKVYGASATKEVGKDCLDRIEAGMRRELLKGQGRTEVEGLQWLHTPLDEYVEDVDDMDDISLRHLMIKKMLVSTARIRDWGMAGSSDPCDNGNASDPVGEV